MPKYLAMFTYSNEAMAAMIENPADREPAVRRVLESVGAHLEAFYWMFGSHDGVAVVEAPDCPGLPGADHRRCAEGRRSPAPSGGREPEVRADEQGEEARKTRAVGSGGSERNRGAIGLGTMIA